MPLGPSTTASAAASTSGGVSSPRATTPQVHRPAAWSRCEGRERVEVAHVVPGEEHRFQSAFLRDPLDRAALAWPPGRRQLEDALPGHDLQIVRRRDRGERSRRGRLGRLRVLQRSEVDGGGGALRLDPGAHGRRRRLDLLEDLGRHRRFVFQPVCPDDHHTVDVHELANLFGGAPGDHRHDLEPLGDPGQRRADLRKDPSQLGTRDDRREGAIDIEEDPGPRRARRQLLRDTVDRCASHPLNATEARFSS